jgi:hypothetical protein
MRSQVHFLARQQAEDFTAVARAQVHAHVGPLQRELHQHRRQQMLRREHGADAQRPRADALQLAQFVAGLFPQLQDAFREIAHDLTRRGELDIASHLAREGRAGQLFERA